MHSSATHPGVLEKVQSNLQYILYRIFGEYSPLFLSKTRQERILVSVYIRDDKTKVSLF